ncbi:MAG: hypothetical protein ABIK93_05040 [candidate division WOR-3 bacterium]
MRQIVIGIVVSILLVVHCTNPKKEVRPKPAESTVTFKFQSKLGEIFMGPVQGVDLTGLPKVLLYPKAKPLARYGKYEIPRWGCSYNLETTDAAETVLQYYHKILKGWKLVSSREDENYHSITYVPEDEKEVVEVNVAEKEGKRIIVLYHTYN